jgi:hypothetical protein
MNSGSKISDEQFLSILRENAGLYSKTAKAIQEKFSISYSRQAVRDRAASFPEDVKDIEEENLDIAEEGLHSLAKSNNETIKLKACELILKTKGKKRGYIERNETEHSGSISFKNITGMEIK